MDAIVRNGDVETEGESVASSRHRERAIKLWREVSDSSGLQDKVLADAASMTPKHYSKVAAGHQGDLLGMVMLVGETYPKLRRAFITGLAEIENADPLAQAAELLAAAAMRFLRLQGERLPLRMARADLAEGRKRGIA